MAVIAESNIHAVLQALFVEGGLSPFFAYSIYGLSIFLLQLINCKRRLKGFPLSLYSNISCSFFLRSHFIHLSSSCDSTLFR